MTEFQIGDEVRVTLTGVVRNLAPATGEIFIEGESEYFSYWIPSASAEFVSRPFSPVPGKLYRDRDNDLWICEKAGHMTYLCPGDDLRNYAANKDLHDAYGPFREI